MNREHKKNNITAILIRITVVTLLMTVTVSYLVIGATQAWFTGSVSISENTFIVEVGTESAWTDGDYDFGPSGNQRYFIFKKGDTGTVSENIFIGRPRTDVIGTISVEEDGDKLEVKFLISESQVKIKTIDLFVGLYEPDFTPADYGNKVTFDPAVTEYIYYIDEVEVQRNPYEGKNYKDVDPGTNIYITAKLDVYDNR